MRQNNLISAIVLLLLSVCLNAGAEETDEYKAVYESMKRVDEYQKQIDIKAIQEKNDPRIEEAAKEAADQFHSPEFQAKIKQEQERIRREVFKENLPEETKQKEKSPQEKGQGEILIFISSSMPMELLREYARQANDMQDQNVRMVMRGFVGSLMDFKPTLQFIQEILKQDPACDDQDCELYRVGVDIDPPLFRSAGVTEVPTIVCADVSTDEGRSRPDEINGCKIVGAVPIRYALEKCGKKVNPKSR